jgi:hypothetical protein
MPFMSTQVQMQVELTIDGLSKDHSARMQAVEEFLSDVDDEPGVVVKQQETTAQESLSKGGIQELILAPGSASALWAIVRITKLWLARDRRRTIDLSISRPGSEPLTVHASGENLSLETLESTVRRALET